MPISVATVRTVRDPEEMSDVAVDETALVAVLPRGHTLDRPDASMATELVALVHTCDIASIGVADFSADDVREWLEAAFTRPETDGWVVRNARGRLVAWAYLESMYDDRREDATVYVHPKAHTGLFRALVELLIDRSAQRATAGGRTENTLHFWWAPGEADLEYAAKAAGATFVRRFARMHRHLSGTERPVAPPRGVRVHGIDHTDETAMRAFHRVVLEAFSELPGGQAAAYEAWRAHISAATTMPFDEWLIAEVGGRPVGVLQTADTSADQTGWVRNLGILPACRRRGIARNLLENVFATFARKGYTSAGLTVDIGDEPGEMRVYESAGMTLLYESEVWQVIVPAATKAIPQR